jgi:hypothetical protein
MNIDGLAAFLIANWDPPPADPLQGDGDYSPFADLRPDPQASD